MRAEQTKHKQAVDKRLKPICWLSSVWLAPLVYPLPAQSHPHVFVDGGVDFMFDEKNLLSALLIN